MSTTLEWFSLADRTALVVGGTRGMGYEICRGLSEAGARVALVGRRLEVSDARATELARSTGGEVSGFGCNISHWDEIDGLVEDVEAKLGPVDILVNNAGMSPLYESVDTVTEALWDKVIGVNLKGPFRLCALLGTRMMARGRGSIINIGSSSGLLRPRPHRVPYDAAKSGLVAITIGLAHAFAPDVRVNCVMPGPFHTDVAEAAPAIHHGRAKEVALGRPGRPEEIVGSVLYLASDAASFTTGATLRVDGGGV
ncbi:MAG: SDR family oxidoreductase [Acidimicrobiales bacterium]|nr:SDR family oxidoreductase [Acidimicrobiales bacterium]